MSRTKTILVTAVFTLSGAVASLVPATASAAAAKKPCTQQNYRSGSRGNCVNYIQNMLNLAQPNQTKLDTDGRFGPKTRTAVRAWQTDKKLVVDGIVGPETWRSLCSVNDTSNEAYKAHKLLVECDKQWACIDRKFSTGTNRTSYCVAAIQGMLNLANSARLDIDSKFGPKTRAAVVAWQKKQKTTDRKMLVDGIVGKQTWKKLCDHKMPSSSEQAVYDTSRRTAGCK